MLKVKEEVLAAYKLQEMDRQTTLLTLATFMQGKSQINLKSREIAEDQAFYSMKTDVTH